MLLDEMTIVYHRIMLFVCVYYSSLAHAVTKPLFRRKTTSQKTMLISLMDKVFIFFYLVYIEYMYQSSEVSRT